MANTHHFWIDLYKDINGHMTFKNSMISKKLLKLYDACNSVVDFYIERIKHVDRTILNFLQIIINYKCNYNS